MLTNVRFYQVLTILILFNLVTNVCVAESCNESKKEIFQSEREIPIVSTVDIVIIGGTTAAVNAAISASKQKSKVFLITSKPYLGDDFCSTLRLESDENRINISKFEEKIYKDKYAVSPLHVKSILNKELIDHDVDFVFSSYVTDILWDDNNQPKGVVIGNKAGRQAVIANVIIDATDRAWVGRMAGATAYKWEGRELAFQRVVVMPGKDEGKPRYVTHVLNIPMPDLNFTSFAKAEQTAREKTYTEGQLRASESLFHIPPDPIVCVKRSIEWDNSKFPDVKHFTTNDFNNLFILSGSADIPRIIADSLLRPGGLVYIAEIIGLEAAKSAKRNTTPQKISFKSTINDMNLSGDISEILTGFRAINNVKKSVVCPEMGIPIIAHYDIVVVGGGTSGAPAAIAAARQGLTVLVVEYLEGLGGMGTLGLIGKPWHGKKIGFAEEIPFPEDNSESKMEWYRSEIQKAGGDIWLGVLGCGAYLENNSIKGVVICTPEGRGVITSKVVIDATGSADVAIAAGADYMYGDIENDDIALQGTGLSSRPLKGNYFNSDYLLVDESDMVDIWRSLVSVHLTKASEDIYDVVPVIQNRERKRIVGDYILNYLDQVAERTFPDVIVISSSSYDSHGYPSSTYFALLPHDSISRKINQPAPGGTCFTPYRCLLPQNLEGILVTGLGISMERDASAMIRMQLDLGNQGYAAGIAAAMAIENGVHPRYIDVKKLQELLIKKGNLPEDVLLLGDSFPLSDKAIYEAVISYGKSRNPQNAGKPLAIILSHKCKSLPMIKKEYESSTGKTKLLYAQVLGMCGEREGVLTLLDELKNFTEWDEKIFQGSMADYAHLPTPIDAVILALGFSGDKSVLPVILNLVNELDSSVTFSHHRSVALALEKIADPRSAKSLAGLLQKSGMSGYTMHNLKDALVGLDNDGKGQKPIKNSSTEKRTKALREIILARVLFNCGDYNGIGENILKKYQTDLQGLFARHAHHVLIKQQVNLKK